MAYDDQFLGITLPLPAVLPGRSASIVHSSELTNEVLAEYPNYAVITDAERRAPAYVVALLNRPLLKPTSRTDSWRVDSRIGAEFQLDNAYYARNEWDRGHMARRASAGWGETTREAQKAADATFYYSNACLQHENVNQDEWLALEDWVQDLAIAKDGKTVVFAGPVYGSAPRVIIPDGRAPGEIPAAFFKVVAFINNGTEDAAERDRLDVRAFLMFQDEAAIEVKDKQGRLIFEFQHYQTTIREIESLTGLGFPDVIYERNPLYFYPDDEVRNRLGVTHFPERVDVNAPSDLVGHGQRRTPVRDDEIQVYLAAAQPVPANGADEWVSVLNLENTSVDLKGWRIQDKQRRAVVLNGVLQPGEAAVFRSSTNLRPVLLPNEGGVLTLLNDLGEQVDRVDYTQRDLTAARGLPIFFPTYRPQSRQLR
jgi:endonuclease G, mitochondrial